MPNTHKPPPETGRPLEERYSPGDPIPAPETIETNTDSAWALWQDSTQEPRPTFDETVPMGLEDMPPIRRG